jgi:hypothetical protein
MQSDVEVRQTLRRMITMDPVRGTDLIVVKVRSTDLEDCIEIVKAIPTSYSPPGGASIAVHAAATLPMRVGPNVTLILIVSAATPPMSVDSIKPIATAALVRRQPARIRAPAIAMMIVGGIGIAFTLLAMWSLIYLLRTMPREFPRGPLISTLPKHLVFLATYAVVLFGGLRMVQLRCRRWGVFGAVILMVRSVSFLALLYVVTVKGPPHTTIPAVWICVTLGLLGLGVGIWAAAALYGTKAAGHFARPEPFTRKVAIAGLVLIVALLIEFGSALSSIYRMSQPSSMTAPDLRPISTTQRISDGADVVQSR